MSTSRGRSDEGLALSPGARHRSRERALGLCYEAETKGQTIAEVLSSLPSRPDRYARALAAGTAERGDEIDTLIAAHSTGWAFNRLSAVDRQILRIATFELLSSDEVPLAVVIDEAVELAKEFSTEESGSFVNGVLSTIGSIVREKETT